LQSGKDRGVFVSKIQGDTIHLSEVTGLGIDTLNKQLVSSSIDCTIKLWDFYRRELLKTFNTEHPVENLVYNRINDLIAYSQTDVSLTIMNAKNSLTKVREFKNAAFNKITDICFS
jgi:WD40 repeat protein